MMLNRTRFGRNAYGIGSSPEVARLSGISLRANLYFAYGISGLMAGCRPDGASAHGRADGRSTYKLYTIAAPVIGDAQSQRSAGYHHGLGPWCTDHDDHRKWRKPLRDRRLLRCRLRSERLLFLLFGSIGFEKGELRRKAIVAVDEANSSKRSMTCLPGRLFQRIPAHA
jgi:hypothetical protein